MLHELAAQRAGAHAKGIDAERFRIERFVHAGGAVVPARMRWLRPAAARRPAMKKARAIEWSDRRACCSAEAFGGLWRLVGRLRRHCAHWQTLPTTISLAVSGWTRVRKLTIKSTPGHVTAGLRIRQRAGAWRAAYSLPLERCRCSAERSVSPPVPSRSAWLRAVSRRAR
ncbi:hypothetical protein FQZ97_784370 [compost metagenome]